MIVLGQIPKVAAEGLVDGLDHDVVRVVFQCLEKRDIVERSRDR